MRVATIALAAATGCAPVIHSARELGARTRENEVAAYDELYDRRIVVSGNVAARGLLTAQEGLEIRTVVTDDGSVSRLVRSDGDARAYVVLADDDGTRSIVCVFERFMLREVGDLVLGAHVIFSGTVAVVGKRGLALVDCFIRNGD